MAKYLHIFNRVAHIQRYRQILFVLLKHGFDDVLARMRVYDYLKLGPKAFFSKSKKPESKLISPKSIRLALEELGPTFIKMGQMLSTRPDLLPPDVISELEKLQDDVAPFEFAKVEEIFQKEFGKAPTEIFETFSQKPLAAGSIGQVHVARLVDGEKVVVKVRRPGIRRAVEVDLEIMAHFAALMEKQLDLAQIQKPTALVAEFRKAIMRELDFYVEASHMHRFAHQFRKEPAVLVPKLHEDLCSERVLTMAFVEGTKPRDPQALADQGIDTKEVAIKGADLLFQQVFIHGFFHADPHPGNILVMDDGRICFLDFGMMGRLDRTSRDWFTDIFVAVISQNEIKVADLLLRLTHGHNLVNRSGLEREIAGLIDQYLFRPLKKLNVGQLMGDLFALTIRHELSMPPQFFLLIKAISQMEDLATRMEPDFDLPHYLGPQVRLLLMRRYGVKRFLRDVYESGSDLMFLLREVPGELREILKLTKHGKMRMEFQHDGLEPLRSTLDRVSSRIASAIVLASMIVGSSLIVVADVPPKWHEIPVIGLGGYVFSAFMGLSLLTSIYNDRHR